MKARTNWLIQRERNTTFFHISTLNRRSQNRIVRIQNADGLWEGDVDRVKEIFLEGFAKLFSSKQVSSPRSPINFLFGVIGCLNLRLSTLPLLPRMLKSSLL